MNGIRGLAAVEYDLDGKHPSKALIKKDIRGFRGTFTGGGRNVSERNGEGCASEGKGTYLSISPVDSRLASTESRLQNPVS